MPMLLYIPIGEELSDLAKSSVPNNPTGNKSCSNYPRTCQARLSFGALVLMRPLIERTAIVSYLHDNPNEIEAWKSGWQFNERPSLATMLDSMSAKQDIAEVKKICDLFNHLVHGDPVGASWNLTKLNDGSLGYSVGKVINDAELCDFICFQSYCYLIVLMSMMTACFPNCPKSKE